MSTSVLATTGCCSISTLGATHSLKQYLIGVLIRSSSILSASEYLFRSSLALLLLSPPPSPPETSCLPDFCWIIHLVHNDWWELTFIHAAMFLSVFSFRNKVL